MINGKFIISLDFELLWGMRDKKNIANYGENISGVHQVIPRLLKICRQYNVKGTYSIVGFLFFENKIDLMSNLPNLKPLYKDVNLSPYNGYFDTIEGVSDNVYHFAPLLIKEIQNHPENEIGTHTFSHYYCLEKGQTIQAFRNDLQSAINVAKKQNLELTSLIFPRNQFNKDYLDVCSELGIICYRGNENSWLYRAKNAEEESLLRRFFRIADAYFNISGHNCYSDRFLKDNTPVNIPSSRFLRPYSRRLKFLEGLRLRRIKTGMSYAAKNNLTYHLWWHPHNFGINQNENFLFLEKILQHYEYLNKKYFFKSYTMTELTKELINNNNEAGV